MNAVVEAVHARTGGVLTYTRQLARVMPRLAGAVTLVAPREAVPAGAAEGLRHVPCPSGGAIGGIVAAAPVVARALRSGPEPVLFASANFTLQPRSVPQLLLMRNPIYFDPAYEAHVLAHSSPRQRLGVAVRRGLCLASGDVARYVITPTRAMRDMVLAVRPELAGRIEDVPYGVDIARFVAAARDRRPAARGTLRVVSHSLIARHKPTWPIIEGVSRARGRGVDVTLTLLDPPIDAVHDEVPGIEQDRRWARRGLDEGWLTVTGKLPHDRIAPLLAQHDAFAFHTVSESFGHPYVEAMASGLACVVTDLAIARELTGDAAEHVPLFDAGAFADAFERLATDPEAAAARGARGQARVAKAGLTWERHFGRVAELMRILAAGGTPRPPVEA